MNYPNTAPIVYVTPTSHMVLQRTSSVDSTGKVFFSFLSFWSPMKQQCCLRGLVDCLQQTFSHEMPVFSKEPAPLFEDQKKRDSPLPKDSSLFEDKIKRDSLLCALKQKIQLQIQAFSSDSCAMKNKEFKVKSSELNDKIIQIKAEITRIQEEIAKISSSSTAIQKEIDLLKSSPDLPSDEILIASDAQSKQYFEMLII